jgi:hypothetical protein
MTSILPLAMRAIALLDPAHDNTELADAIATIVDDHRPLLANDEDKSRTVALMVAVAYRESTFRNDAIGDRGESHCAYQIHLPGNAKTFEGWTGDDLRSDVNKCAAVAFRMLQQSVRVDRANPVAFYARGPNWRSEAAQRISRDRVALSKRLLAEAIAALSGDES